MPLAPADLLAAVVTPVFATDPARLGRLRIDYPSARPGVSTQSRSRALAQRRVEPLEGALDAPLPEPTVDGLPRREVAGQKPPGASALEQVEDGVQDFAGAMYLWTSPPPLLWSREAGLEVGPFGVRQVGGVASSNKAERRSPSHPLLYLSDSFRGCLLGNSKALRTMRRPRLIVAPACSDASSFV